MRVFSLRDVEEAAREHPDTFKIPPLDERKNLGIGDFAKLIFESWAGTERMWVKIYGVQFTNNVPAVYYGELDNNPVMIPLARGTEIEFEPKHVAGIMTGVRPLKYLEFEVAVIKTGEKFEAHTHLNRAPGDEPS